MGVDILECVKYDKGRISIEIYTNINVPTMKHFHSMTTLRLASAPQPLTRLDTFKCFTVRLPPAPQVTKLVTKDVIRARCTVPAHSTSPAVPAQFDTVLARQSNAGQNLQHLLDGT